MPLEGAGGIGAIAPPIANIDVTWTAGVPGAICPVGVEQVTTVPGVVGSEASGTGARVVSEVPGWVVAENGPGPLSGEVTIVPGVVGRPMAVLPMVETCARQAEQPSSSMLGRQQQASHRKSSPVTGLPRLCFPHRDLVAFREIHHRIEDDLVTRLDAIVHFDLCAEVARNRDLLQVDASVLDERYM